MKLFSINQTKYFEFKYTCSKSTAPQKWVKFPFLEFGSKISQSCSKKLENNMRIMRVKTLLGSIKENFCWPVIICILVLAISFINLYILVILIFEIFPNFQWKMSLKILLGSHVPEFHQFSFIDIIECKYYSLLLYRSYAKYFNKYSIIIMLFFCSYVILIYINVTLLMFLDR